MFDFATKFEAGHTYRKFLEAYGTAEHRRRWSAVHQQIQLSDEQLQRLRGFCREMRVLCLAGTWCGDCVEQCPIFDHFAKATSCIQLRMFDRDDHRELAEELRVCGGCRVPSVVFLSEDGQHVGRYGDRTLARYRHLAAQLSGASCPTGLVPPGQSLTDAVVDDWLDEFERAQLILRTSPRLREKHGD